MKLILTGACGHIGSFIISNIHKIKKVKELILIDNLSSNNIHVLFNIKSKIKTSFHKVDIGTTGLLKKFKGANIIIHCASFTNAENSFSNEKNMYRNNINCMKNVISYCLKNNSKLIHISSASIYGKNSKIIKENDTHLIKPQSPYADIKLREERMLKKLKNKIKFISFRFGTIAGVSNGMRFHTAINKFCLNAALNRDIEVYKTAMNQYRPYLSLTDAFKVFKFCIDNQIFDNEMYNVLSGNYTVKQILNKIKKTKKKIKVKLVNSAIMNKLSYFVDDAKLTNLGIKLNSNIETDIKNTLKLFK